jgi:hypothetical protein
VLHKCSAVSIAFSHSEIRVSTSSLPSNLRQGGADQESFFHEHRLQFKHVSSQPSKAIAQPTYQKHLFPSSSSISDDLLGLASSRRSAPGTPPTLTKPSNYRVARKYRRDSDCDERRECGCEVKPRFSRRTFPDPLPPASLARRSCVPSHADLCDWFQGSVCGVFPC